MELERAINMKEIELPRLPNAIYLKHGKDHYLPTMEGEMVKVKFIKNLTTPAIRSQAHIERMRRSNSWLSDFMGADYLVDFEVHDYDTGLACRIMSKDERIWFIGTAPYGLEIEYKDRMQEAINTAVKKAFDAFSQTLPRMDRIMRYGV